MRVENSLITSLSELRAIEQQRIADERAAIERDRFAKIEAARAAEQAKVDAAEAKLRAEREELMRIENARINAEREARMRVEATEAAERARLMAQLEERRMAEELDLKRAEVAKKRPTWMLVVTSIAAIAAVGLTLFAVDSMRDRDAANKGQQQALLEQNKAKEELRAFQVQMAALQADVDKFDTKLTDLTNKLTAAQTKADRDRVANEIAAAREERRQAQAKLDKAAADKAHADRVKRVDVTGCTNTALGCLDHK